MAAMSTQGGDGAASGLSQARGVGGGGELGRSSDALDDEEGDLDVDRERGPRRRRPHRRRRDDQGGRHTRHRGRGRDVQHDVGDEDDGSDDADYRGQRRRGRSRSSLGRHGARGGRRVRVRDDYSSDENGSDADTTSSTNEDISETFRDMMSAERDSPARAHAAEAGTGAGHSRPLSPLRATLARVFHRAPSPGPGPGPAKETDPTASAERGACPGPAAGPNCAAASTVPSACVRVPGKPPPLGGGGGSGGGSGGSSGGPSRTSSGGGTSAGTTPPDSVRGSRRHAHDGEAHGAHSGRGAPGSGPPPGAFSGAGPGAGPRPVPTPGALREGPALPLGLGHGAGLAPGASPCAPIAESPCQSQEASGMASCADSLTVSRVDTPPGSLSPRRGIGGPGPGAGPPSTPPSLATSLPPELVAATRSPSGPGESPRDPASAADE